VPVLYALMLRVTNKKALEKISNAFVVELVQNNLHPVVREIQRWQNIIGHQYSFDTWQNRAVKSYISLEDIAPEIGR
jgi:hypothetical protein